MTDLTEERTSQAKIVIAGIGVGSSNLSLGLNLGTMAYLGIRKNRLAKEFTYGVDSALDVGGHSSTVVFGLAYTEWFYISDEAFKALRTQNILGNGFSAEIKVEGTTLGSGKSDVEISLINRQGAHKKIADVYGVGVNGFQLATTSVRGKLKIGPKTINRERQGLSKAVD